MSKICCVMRSLVLFPLIAKFVFIPSMVTLGHSIDRNLFKLGLHHCQFWVTGLCMIFALKPFGCVIHTHTYRWSYFESKSFVEDQSSMWNIKFKCVYIGLEDQSCKCVL